MEQTKLDDLIKIVQDLSLNDKLEELNFYANRLSAPDKDLILPLVGEFSSGKTTLINALLDNPNLETASKATTASIFEIHFGSDKCYAEIFNEDGSVDLIDNVANIKNDVLNKVELVKVHDTSTKVGSSTILVDTPGLSSNNPAHRIALSSYLPNADAIFLLTDINQQLTRSILDFLRSSKIANKPIYLIITKCDTKTPNEIEAAKSYIKESIDFSFADIITISTTQGEMSQFEDLIDKIQKEKNQIVERSINDRIIGVAKEIAQFVENLLEEGSSTEDIDSAINEEQNKLEKLNRNIDSLISDVDEKIREEASHILSKFTKSIFPQVDEIVKSEGRDGGNSINLAVNSTAIMLIQSFQREVISEIVSMARSRQHRIEEVPMGILETIEIAGKSFNGFSSTVDLSNIGHKWDKSIGYSILGTLAIAGTVVTAGAATAASVTAGGSATGTIIAADAATDLASVAYTSHKMNKIAKMAKISHKASQAKKILDDVGEQLDSVQKYNEQMGRKVGMNRGVIETSVGWITDFFAKPARQKAVDNFIHSEILPEFRMQLQTESNTLLKHITSLLRQEAENSSENLRNNLSSLKESLSNQKEEYTQRVEKYKLYLMQLNGFDYGI